MRVVAILQARMGSTRLPGKSLLSLAGKSMVLNIVERVSRAKRVDKVIVAAPQRDVGDFLCQGFSVVFYDGDENDLIGRYLDAATYENADIIVRVPCDNPCVDPEYIDRAIQQYMTGNHIFYTNTQEWTGHHYAPHVDGIGCEVFSMSRLKLLDHLTRGNAEQREHPHRWFYSHMNLWKPDATLFLDVNTKEDFDFITSIYDHFGNNSFTTQEVLNCPPVQERLHGR
jgi:spore coat polysaccharide biosynthesis protein SpsF (cytidylyltransferase family)